jgi:hypothetical protein
MKKHVDPPGDAIWRELFAGDSFYTKQPYAVLVAMAETLAPKGYTYVFKPANKGHIVRCTKSPLVTTQDGYDLLTGTERT